ncbi:MAG: hypothetical protein RLZZ244_2576 [Verrucomicrobiota bacterium]|jgi:urea transport system permease protein
MRKFQFLLLLCTLLLLPFGARGAGRETLVGLLLLEDVAAQQEGIRGLVGVEDPWVREVLSAWRQGAVHVLTEGEARIPVLLDPEFEVGGEGYVTLVSTGKRLMGGGGAPLKVASDRLEALETNPKLRKAIKATLDLGALGAKEPRVRLEAARKLGEEQSLDYLSFFETALKQEKDGGVRRALEESIAITRLASEEYEARLRAVTDLGRLRSIAGLSFLQKLPGEAGALEETRRSEFLRNVQVAIRDIERYVAAGNTVGTGFRGLSLAAVLLVAALGLAITFGLMGIINMAHGELMMVGAYGAYMTQGAFQRWFGESGLNYYFPFGILFSFGLAALVGLVLERGIVRFLYRRPLESMLATWGVSLLLQQVYRDLFGAANVQVSSPGWLSGSFVVCDVLFAYNRIFVIGFAVLTVGGTWALLTRTNLGLQVRAVMQNRGMAAALGVRTDRVNMLTFALGSGLAGVAGACLSQIGNVGPSLGQSYIVDCFMVVVLGGVGSLVGTVLAALGIGVCDQILQPWLGAVLGKITVLVAIILFLQWNPSGFFAPKSRSLEG